MKIVAIDPGTNKAGVAIMWRSDGKEPTIMVEKHYLIVASKTGLTHQERTKEICEQIGDIVHEAGPETVVIEYPTARPGISHLDRLLFFCGYLAHVVDISCPHVYLYTVGKSKGNLPKEVVRHRVFKKYNLEASEDEMDAIYLGHRYLTDVV